MFHLRFREFGMLNWALVCMYGSSVFGLGVRLALGVAKWRTHLCDIYVKIYLPDAAACELESIIISSRVRYAQSHMPSNAAILD